MKDLRPVRFYMIRKIKVMQRLLISDRGKRGYYIELKAGSPFIGANMFKTISDKGNGPYMTPKDVYGYLLKMAGAPGELRQLDRPTAAKKNQT